MNHLIIIILFFPLYVFGQDTIKVSGGYEVGKFGKNKNRIGCWTKYDSSGTIQGKRYYRSRKRKPYKIIKYDYEDSIFTIGQHKTYSGKWGKYKTYEWNGKLILIERYRYNRLHGLKHDLINHNKERYYFGYKREELYNAKNQRYVFFFAVGMPLFRDWDCEEELFACKRLQISGCLVSNEMLRRQAIHNFFVNIKQSIRFGLSWKNKYFKGIGCEKK